MASHSHRTSTRPSLYPSLRPSLLPSLRPSIPCAAFVTATLLVGCGASEEDRPSSPDSLSGNSLTPSATEEETETVDDTAAEEEQEVVDYGDLGGSDCDSYAIRQCSIDLGTYNGVHSCVQGVQYCTDGRWGACQEGSMEDQ